MKNPILAAFAALSLSAAVAPLANAAVSYRGSTIVAAENSLSGAAYHRPDAGQPVLTGGGRTVVTTGRIGGMQTTTLPGGAGQGILMNNGNGTSTLIGPGTFSTMPTPR
jgi:hypothetical protein